MAFDVEQLFKAVDIIIGERLENVNFDKTIICTIVDDSDKKNGCYVVSDGTIKFKAYANDTSYKTDDQVRVSVLNGDFSEKKFISGRYTGDEESNPITYKSPLESIIPITGNLVTHTRYSNSDGVNSLRANSEITSLDIWNIDLTSNSAFRDLQSNGIYNTLTLKADFKTLMSHHDLIAGNYGLRLDLFIQPSLNSTQRIRRYITLDSSEMMGNPYSFSIYSTQAKKVDIISTGIIAEMVLWIYQSVDGDGNKSRFITREGDEINPSKFDDILIKNIEIGFGSDIEKVSDNTLELFTSSSPYYVYDNESTDTNRKELEVLWYNKTENNEYVGYSDGLFDLNYDEIEYLKKSNLNSRLMSQVGRTDVPSDESGLKLAADLKDAKPIMIKARDALTTEVADVLYNLQRQAQSANSIYTKLDGLLDTVSGSLVQQWNSANTELENWNSAYVGALQYAYDKENKVKEPSQWNSDWDTDYYTNFKDAIKLGVKLVRDFFIWFDEQTGPTALQSGHRGNYDLYFYRIEKELEIIEDWLDELDTLLNGNYNKLIAYKSDAYVFTPYKQVDFSAYNNKYCLYWYRYEPGYKLEYKKDANNDEYNFGKFMSDGWRRMQDMADVEWHTTKELPRNYGLPIESKVNDIDGKTYYVAKALGQIIKRDMVREMVEEKYAVILFYNHEMYKSNIITFTNSEPDKIPKEELLDKKDVLQIEHDVDSLEHYQVYNEFNQLRSLDDGGRIRQLKCFYKGLYKQNEALINAGVYWYIPNHNTMLTIDTDYLQQEGFNTDAGGRTEHSIDGYTYYYKKINPAEIINDDGSKFTISNEADRIFYYKIKPYLEKDATNNTIKVRAYLQGIEEPVEGEITMTFSTFGSNGTKYTLSVVPSGSQVSVMEDKPLQLKVGLRDYNNQVIKIVDVEQATNANNAYGFEVKDWERSPNAFDIATIFDETNTYVEGLTVSLNKSGKAKNWDTTRPYFGIINAKVTYYIANETETESDVTNYDKSKTVTLNTLVPLTYASGNYYMSGATTIVYNNQGTVSYMSEDEYLLYRVNQKGQTPIKNQVWSLEYYDNTGRYIQPGTDEYEMLKNYMPVLKQGENRLVPAPLYIENLNYVPVVICTVNGDFAWAQPIIITQNRYASLTLDSWNGSLTIDEKNGTILSTAVGAGKKEDDNSFSGVLMGDIGKGVHFDTDNMSGLGLYGFNKGAQSFCLSVDGTAFFGKAGRGRILINGDQGTIASASYETVRRKGGDPSGMMIDLDDGYIHILGVKKEGLDYFPDKETTAQAEILINATGMWNGNGDAYFKIRSKQQTDSNHYLMFVGSDEYYLQTDDYTAWNYDKSDSTGELDFNGKGLRLDLKDGKLDSYNFQLSSKNVYIDSTDSSEGFFIIKDNFGVNLFFAGKDDYYLKSSDYQTINKDNLGSGMKLTLMTITGNTGIEAYNFDLRAGNTGYGDHEIVLSDSGDPYFMVNTAYNNATKTLINISKTEQSFQSSDYDATNKQGIRLSLSGKELKAYSGFTLQAYKSGTSQYVLLDATASDYPLKVYGSADKYFQVNWNGGLEATGATIKGTINATGGSFSGDIKVTGTLDGGTITGATITGGTLNIGNGQFTVNGSGHMVCKSATIGGWTVTESNFSGNGITFSGGSGISSPYWNVDKDGKTTITDLIVSSSLTTSNTCQVYIDGNVGIGIKPVKGYDLVLGGKMKIAGSVYFGDTAYLYANGGLFYVKEASWIYLDAGHVKVGNEGAGIGIGGNPAKDAGVTIIYGKVQVNSPDDFVLLNADGKTVVTLANYIKNIGDFDTNTVTANAYFLVSSDGKKTKYTVGTASQPVYFSKGIPVACDKLYAPTTKGTSGQVWTSGGSNGSPSWKSISAPSWNDISDRPETFNPVAHDHTGTNHRHSFTLYYSADKISGSWFSGCNSTTIYTNYTSMVLGGP